ncbi:MAG TPA: hypothetical protein VLV86_20530 [Vicinamibacterales bacterium]|nr:hypothetical protein [Vicinamibacterales bacterium]
MADALSALQTLEHDLRDIFGSRLRSLVHYGARAHTTEDHYRHRHHGNHEADLVHALAVVETLTPDDLRGCAKRITSWHDEGLATPLVMPNAELDRSLDVFPFEFSAIIADHVIVAGSNPFEGLRVEPNDLRWACEVQARGHLLHLRQGYVEARGRDDALAVLIVRSAPAWKSLLENMARLENTAATPDEITQLVGTREISNEDAVRLFPKYLDQVERLTKHVDTWSASK